jgi:hypothetical protein
MYRPTVRYSDSFKSYVDDLFNTTHLDRNQIIRAALFAAAHSNEFRSILENYKKAETSLPRPLWRLDEEECWKNQSYTPKPKKTKKAIPVESVRVINKGGIKYVSKTSPPPAESVTL